MATKKMTISSNGCTWCATFSQACTLPVSCAVLNFWWFLNSGICLLKITLPYIRRKHAQFPANGHEKKRDKSPAKRTKTPCGFEVAVLASGTQNWPLCSSPGTLSPSPAVTTSLLIRASTIGQGTGVHSGTRTESESRSVKFSCWYLHIPCVKS